MKRPRAVAWVFPTIVLALLIIGLPLVALTETGAERSIKQRLGIVGKDCVPTTAASPGWRVANHLPVGRDDTHAVTLDGKIYLAGGITAITRTTQRPGKKELRAVASLRSFTRFDPRTGRYTDMAPLPEPLNHVGVVTYRGDIYVVGGHGKLLDGEDPKAGLYRYSVDENRWTRLASMPTARGAAATGVVDGRLYVAGGMVAGQALTTVEAYDFRQGRWLRVADLPAPREHVASAVVGGRFYVIGGRNRWTDALRDVTRYDPRRNRWERVADLPVHAGGLDAARLGDQIIVMGGGNDRAHTITGAVQRFDPRSGRWTELAPMRTARSGMAVAAADGTIYSFGGFACAIPYQVTDLVEAFRPPDEGRNGKPTSPATRP